MSDLNGKAGQGPGALFQFGQLTAAVQAGNAAVRAAPADLSARMFLAELLLFAGNFDRIDVILDAAGEIDPQAMVVIAEFRQLLRAEMARRQFWREGRVPEFLGEPTATQRLLMAASVSLRAGDPIEAGKLAEAAEAARPPAPGHMGDVAFDDFRDIDDVCGGSLEVLTSTGKYYWIPVERIASMEFHPPKRARDLFWRRVTMSVNDGPDGDVYLPCLYGTEDATMDDAVRLGRVTEWRESEGAPVRGVGQRTFLVGDEAVEVMSLASIEFDAA